MDSIDKVKPLFVKMNLHLSAELLKLVFLSKLNTPSSLNCASHNFVMIYVSFFCFSSMFYDSSNSSNNIILMYNINVNSNIY
jgi:hypothetical protein